MKKRILAFLLAVSIAVSVLVLPVSAASINNTALQTAITLGAVPTGQELGANVTRGAHWEVPGTSRYKVPTVPCASTLSR